MSRFQKKFDSLKNQGRKALITFITAGDPDLDTTKKLIKVMEEEGADIVELGIPFSDPIAEGPVIQAANTRAMKNKIKIKNIMDMVREIRKETDIPLAYLVYFNCILQYGPDRFFMDCRESGVDGVIIPDLPFEEMDEIKETALKYSVAIISLVSSTSKERIKIIAQNAGGFLYCVSSLGVTGMRSDFNTDFDEFFSYINRYTKIPTAIGFGISTPEHVRQLKKYADGLIVGSAIVKRVGESADSGLAVKSVGQFVRELRSALDER